MDATGRSNISSTPPPSQGSRDLPARLPRRDEIAGATIARLKSGGPTKADLLVVDVGEGPVVVKDFAAKPWWARAIGRVLIGREIAAYRWLGPVRGVARLIGRVDAHALAVEKIDTVPLAPGEDRRDERIALVPKIRDLVDRLHARGLVHLDLNRGNLMRRADGELFVVDLAGALWLRPGGLVHRLLFSALASVDERSFLKWKERLAPGSLSPGEEALFRRLRRRRRFWIFNRGSSRDNEDGP